MSFAFLRPAALRSLTAALFGGALALASASSQATTYTVYTDYASFAAAVSSLTLHQFPDGGGAAVSRPYTLDDYTVGTTSRVSTFKLMNDGAFGAGQTYLSDYTLATPTLGVTPPDTSVYAMGFTLGTLQGADDLTLKLNYYDVLQTVHSDGGGSTIFVGVIASDPIVQALFTASSTHEIDLLNFYSAEVAAVPEPASALLFAAGGLALVARRRRQRGD